MTVRIKTAGECATEPRLWFIPTATATSTSGHRCTQKATAGEGGCVGPQQSLPGQDKRGAVGSPPAFQLSLLPGTRAEAFKAHSPLSLGVFGTGLRTQKPRKPKLPAPQLRTDPTIIPEEQMMPSRSSGPLGEYPTFPTITVTHIKNNFTTPLLTNMAKQEKLK